MLAAPGPFVGEEQTLVSSLWAEAMCAAAHDSYRCGTPDPTIQEW